jgi:hypothetical protein
VLRLALPQSGGLLALENLDAPEMALTLDLSSGTATGQLNVASLQIDATGGSAALSGSVGTQSGAGAATIARIVPSVSADYMLNGCTIGAVNCGISASALAQAAALLEPPSADKVLGAVRKRLLFLAGQITLGIARDEVAPELLLPNVSDRDY